MTPVTGWDTMGASAMGEPTPRFEEDPFRRHRDELRSAAVRLTGSIEEAEELMQDCLAEAVAGLDRLRHRELLGAWLLQILRHRWYDTLRRRTRDRRFRCEPETGKIFESTGVDSELVRLALGRLETEERRVLELRYFESKNSAEIAAILRRPAGTVRSQIFYALRRFEAAYRELSREEES